MTDPNSNINSRTLMVEGPDDCHVVGQILIKSDVSISFKTNVYVGDRRLLDSIGSELRATNRESVGIVVDADTHTDRRWQAVKDRLELGGAIVPLTPQPDGTIISETDVLPRIGIWIMPDNHSAGRLEDFVAKMIPNRDPVWPRSQAYIDDIPPRHRPFKPQKETYAKVLSWIATRESPGFMGEAIGRGDLNIDGELCQTFIAWLNRLFEPEEEVADPT